METPAATAAIIVAAGKGLRAGGGLAKQWRMLAGARVIDRTLAAFAAHVDRRVLVLHPDEMGRAGEFSGVTVVAGGDSRAASVRAGLEALDGSGIARILIHDGARPLVSARLIGTVLAALDAHAAAAPAIEVTDALWRGDKGRVTGTCDRAGLFRAQTPQGFHFKAILAAHRAHGAEALDDVQVARAFGLEVAIVPGEEDNLKLTRAEDFARAERILGARMDVRLGNGFDVHRFGPGDHVVLCGVKVPHGRGLQGHSDADVGLHALTDAIYGALAMGDIGRHFPPSDPQWKGADSAQFFRHAVALAAEMGYGIGNLDVTLLCERPKITPHATEMMDKITKLAGLEPGRVSVKATTTERLGFTGREEGIAALATATLVRA